MVVQYPTQTAYAVYHLHSVQWGYKCTQTKHTCSPQSANTNTHKGRMQSSQQTEFGPISRDTWIKEKGNISLMAECCGWLAHAGYGYLQSHMCTAHLLCVCVV